MVQQLAHQAYQLIEYQVIECFQNCLRDD